MLIFLDADPLSYTFFSIFYRCYPSFSVCLKMLPLSTLRCDYSLKNSHPVRPSKSVSPEVLFSISFVPCLRAAGTYLLPSISLESCSFLINAIWRYPADLLQLRGLEASDPVLRPGPDQIPLSRRPRPQLRTKLSRQPHQLPALESGVLPMCLFVSCPGLDN